MTVEDTWRHLSKITCISNSENCLIGPEIYPLFIEPPISECDESGLSRRLQIRKPSEASWAHVPRANFPGTCFNRKSLGSLYGESFVLAIMYYEVILGADVARSVASVVPLSISGTHRKLVSQCLLVCGSFVLTQAHGCDRSKSKQS